MHRTESFIQFLMTKDGRDGDGDGDGDVSLLYIRYRAAQNQNRKQKAMMEELLSSIHGNDLISRAARVRENENTTSQRACHILLQYSSRQ